MTNRVQTVRTMLLASTVLIASTTNALAQEPAQEPEQAQAQAQAQAAKKPVDENEIVVTARRSSERLMDVPVQVNVATAAQLTRLNATNLEKISENIPFVTITKLSAGNGGAFNIRGIGNFSVDSGVQQSVLLSVDDTFISRPRIVNGAMFDLKQVEVLKGPQALFYGKNTVAGVVSVTSADPTSTLSVRGTAGYEIEARERFVEAAISGPIATNLSARVALRYDEIEGWLKNVATARANPILPAFPLPGPESDRGPYGRDLAGRLTLLWSPSSEFEAKFKYFHDDNHNDGEAGATEIFCAPGITTYTEFGVVDTQTDCKADGVRALNNQNATRSAGQPGDRGGRAYGEAVSDLSSLKLTYDAGSVSLSSVTGYFKLRTDSASNLAYSSLVNAWATVSERSDGLSQEIRLATNFSSPVNFMGGVYLADTKTLYRSNTILFPLPLDPVANTYESFRRFSDLDTRTYSAFGQLRWAIVDTLKLEGGLRYSNEQISASDGNSYVNPAPTTTGLLRPVGQVFVRSKTENNVSPEVTLTWQPTTDQTLYAAYKTGNKPGGYSFPALATKAFTEQNTNFLAEKVKGVEAGYKAEFFDRTLRFTLTGYYFKYTNQQTATFDPAIFAFTVQNASASIVQGVEAEANWEPVSNLNIHAALGYNDAHYKEYRAAQCFALQTAAQGCIAGKQDLSGKTLPRAPKWAGDLGATYDQPIGGNLKLLLSGNGVYTGAYNAGDTLDPVLDTGGYVRLNASVAVGPQDGSWEVGIYGRNLTDAYKPLYTADKALSAPGRYNGVFNRTREILFAVKFQF